MCLCHNRGVRSWPDEARLPWNLEEAEERRGRAGGPLWSRGVTGDSPPSWECPKNGIPPISQFSLHSSTKILGALKSMLPLLSQTVHLDHGQCKEFQRPVRKEPLGLTDLIMRIAKVVFHLLRRKGLLVRGQDNGASKWHVKLAEPDAIIQAFDLTNVFAPSTTSANTSPLSLL